jgi:hypothetical protein
MDAAQPAPASRLAVAPDQCGARVPTQTEIRANHFILTVRRTQ